MLLRFKKFGIFLMTIAAFYADVSVAQGYDYNEQQSNLRMMDRIERIERDLVSIQKQFYRGNNVGNAGKSMDGGVAASLESRLDFLEEQSRNLTGRVELLEHEINKLSGNFAKLQADNNLRFSEIEKKLGVESGTAKEVEHTPLKETPEPSNASTPPKSLGTVGVKEVKEVAEEKTESAENKMENDFKKAFTLVKTSRFDEAEQGFTKFITSYPDDKLVGEAYYWLGEINYNKKNYEKAAVNFLRGYKLFPSGNKASDSLLKLASSLVILKKNKDACAILAKLGKEFPKIGEAMNKKARELTTKAGCK